MLVNGKIMLKHAVDNKYAIPAFGFVNLEGAKAIVRAAEELNAPVMLQMTEGGVKYGGLEELFAIAKVVAEKSTTPVAIHFDHGQTTELLKKGVDLGFSSIMYDGSHFLIEENCSNALGIKNYIGEKQITLEVEVGVIGGKEDDIEAENTIYANINEVKKINDIADPDMIAVAVGTSHGLYAGEININYELIKECHELTKKPIVLHGLSGVPAELVSKSIEYGIRKANFDTELKQAFIAGILDFMKENNDAYDIRKIMQPAINYQVDVVKERIIQCFANDKAWKE